MVDGSPQRRGAPSRRGPCSGRHPREESPGDGQRERGPRDVLARNRKEKHTRPHQRAQRAYRVAHEDLRLLRVRVREAVAEHQPDADGAHGGERAPKPIGPRGWVACSTSGISGAFLSYMKSKTEMYDPCACVVGATAAAGGAVLRRLSDASACATARSATANGAISCPSSPLLRRRAPSRSGSSQPRTFCSYSRSPPPFRAQRVGDGCNGTGALADRLIAPPRADAASMACSDGAWSDGRAPRVLHPVASRPRRPTERLLASASGREREKTRPTRNPEPNRKRSSAPPTLTRPRRVHPRA